MKHAQKISEGVDVEPLLSQLDQHPELWDEIPYRRNGQNSPHAQMQDIWVRYNDVTPFLKKGNLDGFNDAHVPIWYGCAEKIPAVKSLALKLMGKLHGEMLGAVLITRMPSGSVIKPHIDGGWHAGYFDKFYVILRANEACINHYLDESVVMRRGEVWRFDNSILHSVENHGDTERISAIICIRTELFQ